ncbi:hypothetical protein Bbelb_276090 [Branchiostoma belcheri]|nr:hypothetical protein Bbelb_276090 [Branchiostoma belcheri]
MSRLLAVNANKASGPDGIPSKVIRDFACELSTPFCHILNSSFAEGTVPSQWKQAVVVPVPKSQPATLHQLRPISLTSQFAKVAEYFVTKWIHHDITFNQRHFGSLKGRSTVHAPVSLVDKLFKAAENPSTISTVVATDFSKAFDRVHHNTAIDKLVIKGLRPELVPWVCSFISGRKQCVRYLQSL